ncbi:MAG: SDR family oxidoreductase [Gammaproteobacteria bacterium]|nr:MAG: SDR family oxidoreductase [Gammaproteobacteria bacterium]TDJ42652.1 MAG: SDR family oxidoreductase [Gammaproteobacteria bacterium]
MGRLEGKVCLITGAARGQGAVEAKLFAEEGAKVWLTDVLDEAGAAMAEAAQGTYRHLDVRNEDEWSALIEEIVSRDGRIDVLVNNAGIFRSDTMLDTSLEDFRNVMGVNCLGVFLGMRAVAGPMRDAGAGSIVNISSLAGMQAASGAFAYGTSKWAVRGMTKTAAVELARRGVRVNSIHPGLIETDMLDQLHVDPERMTRRVPLGRTATAMEVANLALYLASDESSYSTGSEFVVDGGLSAV